MSYTPTEWTAGAVITSEKLNKIEGGIEDAAGKYNAYDLVIRYDFSTDVATAVKGTFSEIKSAYLDGTILSGFLEFRGIDAGTSYAASSNVCSMNYGSQFDVLNIQFLIQGPDGPQPCFFIWNEEGVVFD